MPGSTPRLALPFPLGTDALAQGDDTIAALAAKLEALNLAWQMAAGTTNVVANALAPSGGATFPIVGWPAGRFTVPPLVFVTLQSATPGSNSAKVTAHAITKDGGYIGLQNANTVSAMTFASTPVAWLAIQMTSAAAPG